MKVSASPDISNVKDIDEVKRFVTIILTQLVQVINGNIGFSDNFLGQPVSVTFTASNADTAIDHGLGKVVTDYVVLNRSANMVVYNGVTASTSARIYLRSSATGTAKIFLL